MVVLEDEPDVGHGDVAKEDTIMLGDGDTGDAELTHPLQGLQDGGVGVHMDDLIVAQAEFAEFHLKDTSDPYFLQSVNEMPHMPMYVREKEAGNVALGDNPLDTTIIADDVDPMDTKGLAKNLSNLKEGRLHLR